VLLEAAPIGMDVSAIGRALASDPRVTSVHDLHLWEIGTDFPALSAHVPVYPGEDCHGVRRDLDTLLRERFAIRHTTLQVEHAEAPVGNASSSVRQSPAAHRSTEASALH
jgi:cobalt-zinc-cadmium efflux system protein